MGHIQGNSLCGFVIIKFRSGFSLLSAHFSLLYVHWFHFNFQVVFNIHFYSIYSVHEKKNLKLRTCIPPRQAGRQAAVSINLNLKRRYERIKIEIKTGFDLIIVLPLCCLLNVYCSPKYIYWCVCICFYLEMKIPIANDTARMLKRFFFEGCCSRNNNINNKKVPAVERSIFVGFFLFD